GGNIVSLPKQQTAEAATTTLPRPPDDPGVGADEPQN
ncbi:MAG: hypothetical protein RIR95_459, partial [Pseudomonadota bacterium]